MTVIRDFRPRLVDDADRGLVPSIAFFGSLGAMFVAFVATAPPPPEPSVDDYQEEFRITPRLPTVVEGRAPAPAAVPADEIRPKTPKTAKTRPAPGAGRPGDAVPQDPRVRAGIFVMPTLGPSTDGTTPDIGALVQQARGPIASFEPGGTRRGDRGTGDQPFLPAAPTAPLGRPTPTLGPLPELPPLVVTPDPPGPPDVETCSSHPISEVVKAGSGQLKHCYASALRQDPSLGGRLDLEWTIADGRVTAVHTAVNNTGSAEFAACVERRIRLWQFAPDCSGDVEWGFLFAPR